MKLDYSKKVKFWSDDINVATGVALIGFVVASLASDSITKLNIFVIYIGTLMTLWGPWSAKLVVDKKSNVISMRKIFVFAIVFVSSIFGFVIL